ncbi:MAG: hypothetical protein II773_03840 [Oscillospiraceae bacterium]|nr:hypothetical protein [Oscillospiraceae bacterium]
MKELAFISQNRIYCLSGGRINELPCGRVIKYKETLADIRRRSEWKTSGSGAAFMGQNIPAADPENVTADISGLACYDGQLVYAVRLDDSGGIYIRSTDRTDMNESLIVSGKEIFPGRMSCQGNKLCISCGENREEKHISLYELPSSFAKELTDGDSIEEAPSMDGERIYFSTAGYARDDTGCIAAVQNKSIMCLDTALGTMDEFITDEKYDFLCPVPDGEGGIYCIRQTAGGDKPGGAGIIKDVLLFPFRMIKSVFGLLNYFSMIFGGESLRSGGSAVPERTKHRDEKQMFIDGNRINAERNLKAEKSRGEKYPGIMPASRVLLHISASGEQNVIKSGVLDYTLLSDGNIAISNGRHIIISDRNGTSLNAYPADRAVSLTEIV